jgi:hypothetical protein
MSKKKCLTSLAKAWKLMQESQTLKPRSFKMRMFYVHTVDTTDKIVGCQQKLWCKMHKFGNALTELYLFPDSLHNTMSAYWMQARRDSSQGL